MFYLNFRKSSYPETATVFQKMIVKVSLMMWSTCNPIKIPSTKMSILRDWGLEIVVKRGARKKYAATNHQWKLVRLCDFIILLYLIVDMLQMTSVFMKFRTVSWKISLPILDVFQIHVLRINYHGQDILESVSRRSKRFVVKYTILLENWLR